MVMSENGSKATGNAFFDSWAKSVTSGAVGVFTALGKDLKSGALSDLQKASDAAIAMALQG